jgi:staphylococcal nuclease domain-containing protein 1
LSPEPIIQPTGQVHPSEPRFEVFFIDYGNHERLPSDRIKPCDAALAAVPAQAKAAQLAYLRVGAPAGLSPLVHSQSLCCASRRHLTLTQHTIPPPPPQIPALDEEFGEEAAATLAQLVGGGKRLKASVIGRERPAAGARDRHPARAGGKLVVVLKEEGAARSINAEMLAGGSRALACFWGGGGAEVACC